MSKNTSVESSTRSSPNQSINPALQAALGSLDVHLEEELARYRRQRAGNPVMPTRGLGRHQTRKSIDLIAIEKPKDQTQQRALGMSTAVPITSLPLFMVNQTPVATPPGEAKQESEAQPEQLNAWTSRTAEPDNALVAPSLAANNSGTEASATEQLTSGKVPGDRGNLVPVPVATASPDDYLESSEQLLRSLSEEEASVQPQKRSTSKLLTPLGVGSILLLLLSSATAAYILTNPSTSTALGRLFGSKSPTAQNPTQTTVANKSGQDSPTFNGPNLASDEFVDLNLNTLSHLGASPTPSPPAAPVPQVPDLPSPSVTPVAPPVVPNSALPKRSSDLSSTLFPSSAQRGVLPSQVVPLPAPQASALRVATPSPASNKQKRSLADTTAAANKSLASTKAAAMKKSQVSPSPTQVAANTASGRDDFYYVLVNSSSGRALEQARTIVPDAYVRDFPAGSRIQMGAFPRESDAKTLVEQLKQQGISASIYRP